MAESLLRRDKHAAGAHVAHILTKLELHSRTEIAREASIRGM